MMDDPYTIHGLTIEFIVSGMRDAMESDSPALRKLALNIGASALEYLIRDYTTVCVQHSQMTKIIADLPDGHELQVDDAG